MSEQNGQIYEFEGYRIEADERLLRRNNEVVQLPPKAVDLLLVLLESPGHVVSKNDLITRVWTDTIVEEANISHNIFLLRKAFGGGNGKFIETVPKRGYRFVADVSNGSHRDEFLKQTVTRISLKEEIEGSNEELANFPFNPGSDLGLADTNSRRQLEASENKYSSRRALTIAGVAVGLAIVAVAAFFMLGSYSPNAQAPEISFTRVTNSGKACCSSISPDGKFIAYGQNHLWGEGMLFVRQTDTNREIKLIEPAEIIFGGIAFSPDSRFVYYVAIDKQDPGGALYRIPVLGGVPTRLLQNFGSRFTISPDGKQAAFIRKNDERTNESIVITNLDGSGEREVFTRALSETDIDGIAAFAPDGKTIAFAADTERRPDKPYLESKLFTLNIESGEIKKLSDEIFSEIGMMNWMPDASGLLFVGNRPGVGNQFYFFDFETGLTRQVTKGLQGYGNYGLGITADGKVFVADVWEAKTQIWSVDASGKIESAVQMTSGETDGRYGLSSLADGRLAYIARTGNDFDIWTMREDGTDAKPLTADEFSQSDLAASPDGSFLVFSSDKGGGNHIFRINADSTDLRQLTFGESADGAPDISPDGAWVVYAAWYDRKTTLRKVSIDGGDPIQLTDYNSVAPALSPDGTMISCILPNEAIGRPATIAVVSIDGGKPLKTFPVAQFGWWYRPALWSPNGEALIFRRDEKGVGNLWRQSVAGGEPSKITNFNSDLIYNYTFSRDGSRLFVSRGPLHVNTVLIKNFL